MKVFLIIAMVVVVVVFVVGGSLLVDYLNFQNECNKFENGIEAQYNDNRSVYDNGWKTVVEKAQVPKMYTAQLKELYHEAITGRYGPDGSKALFQFIKEQNPTLDPAIFVQIQQSIEVFRNRFAQAQTELVSRKQEYKNSLTTNIRGRLYNNLAGYPKIDLAKYDIVTSGRTEEAFETKKDEPIKLE